jgi:hypothetical protein
MTLPKRGNDDSSRLPANLSFEVRSKTSRRVEDDFRRVGFPPETRKTGSDASDFFPKHGRRFPARRIFSENAKDGFRHIGFLPDAWKMISDASDFFPKHGKR